MSFAEYRRTLKLKTICEVEIPLHKIKCQYNPDLFGAWSAVCGTSLRIDTTPYYHYLKTGDDSKYKRLMKLYGRSETWTANNIIKFLCLFNDIRRDGFDESKGLPVVLNKPIKANKYNDGYECFEGHHRLSILHYLKIKQKVRLCEIV